MLEYRSGHGLRYGFGYVLEHSWFVRTLRTFKTERTFNYRDQV